MASTWRVAALGLAAALTGCTGGVSGIVGGPVAGPGTGQPGATTTTAAGSTTVAGGGSTTTAPGTGTTAVTPSTPPAPSTAPATTAPRGELRLGGDDLGVTRVGAPFRDAVTAVAAALGPPTADPATDSSCVGAEDETSWESFRLASTGGRLSGWLSTSTTLATPAGVIVGTSVAALGQAYGTRLQIPPPAPDSATIFVVSGAQITGTLTGPAPGDTVTSIANGTCQPT